MSKIVFGLVLFTFLCIPSITPSVFAQVQSGTRSSSLLNMQTGTYFQNSSGAGQNAKNVNPTNSGSTLLQENTEVSLKVSAPASATSQTTQITNQSNNLYVLLIALFGVLAIIWFVYYVMTKKQEPYEEPEIAEPKPTEEPADQMPEAEEPEPVNVPSNMTSKASAKERATAQTEKSNKKARRKRKKKQKK
jgi:hypothetical protein